MSVKFERKRWGVMVSRARATSQHLFVAPFLSKEIRRLHTQRPSDPADVVYGYVALAALH